MPRSAMSVSAPPAPTAASCFGSPTSSSLTPNCSHVDGSPARSGVGAAPASSTTTRSPRPAGIARPRRCRCRRRDVPGRRASDGCSARSRLRQRARPPGFARRRARTPAAPARRPLWEHQAQVGSRPRPAFRRGTTFPCPAGAVSTSTAAPEVRMPRSAAAWSARRVPARSGRTGRSARRPARLSTSARRDGPRPRAAPARRAAARRSRSARCRLDEHARPIGAVVAPLQPLRPVSRVEVPRERHEP